MTFNDLSEPMAAEMLPTCLRPYPPPAMSDRQMAYRQHGCVIVRDLIPHDLIDAYLERRLREGQWPTPTPYMDVPELRDICCHRDIRELLAHLHDEEMLLHLNLTGLVSTERDWHQDSYLNPPHVRGFYCAIWFALGNIHPDSGPFEYVPGSHRWPVITRERVLKAAGIESFEKASPDWPKTTEQIVVPAIEAELARSKSTVKQFLPASKGDVLVWHGNLVHRGSKPKKPAMERLAVIAHYSGENHRADMPVRNVGGWFIL